MKIKLILVALFYSGIAMAQDLEKRDFENYTAEKMGDNINTEEYHELIPVISDNNELMYFSRRNHPLNDGGVKDKIDIWWIKRDSTGDDWSDDLHHMESKLNNNGYNFISTTLGDSWQEIVLGAVIFDDFTKSGPSRSSYDGEFWSRPEPMNIENWYNNNEEVHYHFGPDETVLIISAERDDTKGLKDLYFSKKGTNEDGETVWSEPVNMGNINTAGDDVTPFMDVDGETLYFSTDGRDGEGSYDVYRSKRLDDSWTNWSEPENLGTGINTAESEMYFFIAGANDYAYLSRGEKTSDNGDIYRVELLDIQEVTVCGIVKDSITGEPLPQSIVVYANSKGEVLGEVEADDDGKYCVTLAKGDEYVLTPRKDGYYAKDFFVTIPEAPESATMEKDLPIPPITADKLDVIVYFAFDKYEFSPDYFDRLNELNQELNRYVGVDIIVEGHTDYIGTQAYNQALSERRAQAVADYLIDLGLDKDRVTVKGYGEDRPAVEGRGPDARAKNRRVEVVLDKGEE